MQAEWAQGEATASGEANIEEGDTAAAAAAAVVVPRGKYNKHAYRKVYSHATRYARNKKNQQEQARNKKRGRWGGIQ